MMLGDGSGPFTVHGDGPFIVGISIEWGEERTTRTDMNEGFDRAAVGETALTYKRADGEQIGDEYGWITSLDWFDDRDGAVELCAQRWLLIDQWTFTLPDPYPIEDDEDDQPDSDGA